jgi:hypothetical protein
MQGHNLSDANKKDLVVLERYLILARNEGNSSPEAEA